MPETHLFHHELYQFICVTYLTLLVSYTVYNVEGLETVLSETGFNNYHNSSYKIRLYDALRSNKSDVDYICPRYVAKGGNTIY